MPRDRQIVFPQLDGGHLMKLALLALLAILVISLPAAAQSPSTKPPAAQQQAPSQAADTSAKAPSARPEDVKSIDHLLAAPHRPIAAWARAHALNRAANAVRAPRSPSARGGRPSLT